MSYIQTIQEVVLLQGLLPIWKTRLRNRVRNREATRHISGILEPAAHLFGATALTCMKGKMKPTVKLDTQLSEPPIM